MENLMFRLDELAPPPVDHRESTPIPPCESLEKSFRGNFLEEVDKDVLYVDDSIEMPAKELEEEILEEEIEEPSVAAEEEEAVKNCAKCFAIPPTPLKEQMNLPLKDLDDLLFSELLMITKPKDNDGSSITNVVPTLNEVTEIGTASLMVEELGENVLVYMNIQMLDNQTSVSQEVLSVVDRNLKVVHERKCEKMALNGEVSETSVTILAGDENTIRMLKSETKDGKTEKWKRDIPWTEPGDFLCCGANILLTRLLVLEKFVGCIKAWTSDNEGEVILSQHRFMPPETVQLNCKEVRMQQVDRLLIQKNEDYDKHSSYFHSCSGNLLREFCCVNSLFIQLNPFSDLPPVPCLKHSHLDWHSDLQLMSMFMECKSKRKEELKKHFEGPRLHNILRDYVLCIVKNKPKSVMNFTLDFMRKLARDGNGRPEVFETADRRHQQN